MTTMLREKVMIEGLTLANVIWRKFGRQPDGFIAKVLDVNPGLAQAVDIAVGTEVAFPIEELAAAKAKRNVVRLWD